MSAVYDNWERLVGATLRREQLRRIAQRSFSDLSLESSPSSSRRLSSINPSEGGPNYLKIFTFAELKSATRNFRPDRVLDGGGFGWIFKGWLDENTYAPSRIGVGIAVTVKLTKSESEQDLKAWQEEIEFLGKFCHPNIVKLFGYCLENHNFLFVFEYMNKGSLDDHLFRGWAETLPWERRMKIAVGVARALAFLHTSEGQVIHGDINAENILLDGDYNAKLLNFGLTKLGHINVMTTQIVRTFGYSAPEYIATGDLYVSSDVYSFGVLLLVIFSGRRVVDRNRPAEEHNLVDWARPLLSNKRRSVRIMDQKLEGQYTSKAVLQIAELILKCLEPYPKIRPPMVQVLETLEKITTLKMKPTNSKSDHQLAEQPASHSRLKLQLLPIRPKYTNGPGGTTNRT